MSALPRSVVETDHKLEGSHDRASEQLAKHRWHWTLDESNAKRVDFASYARDIGRKRKVVTSYAKGYALYLDRGGRAAVSLDGFTIHDAIRLSELSAENQQYAEIIAEETNQPVARVARGDNRHRMNTMVSHARDLSERTGQSVGDELRRVVRHSKATGAMEARHREEARQRHSIRWLEADGEIAKAKRALRRVMELATDVTFDGDELELLQHSVREIELLSNAIAKRLEGLDVDWDAELDKLGGNS